MWKKYSQKIIVLINCAAIAFMLYVMMAAAAFTVLLGDDFTHGVQVGAFHVSFVDYFMASLRYMKEMYLTWQGTYFAMFLQAFLSPINNFGMPQLKMIMILNVLFFFAALFGAVWTVLGLLCRRGGMFSVRLTLFTVILFSILDARVFTEIFFWYSGAVAYSIPYTFLFLAVTCMIPLNNDSYSKKKKTVLTVCASVCVFFAAGGSLTVSGTACYMVLLLTLGFYLASGKISIYNFIISISGIVGALINAVAPGNFARHTSGSDASLRPVQSLKWAVKNVWSETRLLTKETMFGVMLIIMLIVGIYLGKRIQAVFKAYGIVSILGLAAGYVTAFPVALGYGGPGFPNRCCFILDVILVLSYLNFAVFVGCCLDKWAGLSENRAACAVLYIVLFAAFLNAPESLSESALVVVAESVHNGAYQDYHEECMAIYDYLETCPEEEVVIPMPAYIDNFECFYFDDDPTAWVNVGLAKYYHKKSVIRKNL
ncbi:MAG: DUF6056 family protein [Roseburia sp.]|nr:DUF6056 family protein [Roseburia sp.]MCM1241616.1 DUF6056 family protein [Roseburia sp.]